MTQPTSRVILLASASGSGKSYVARRTGLPVLCLADFYRDGDDPTLPHRDGVVDWESPQSWDAAAAIAVIARLAREGSADVPEYRIADDRRVRPVSRPRFRCPPVRPSGGRRPA